MALTAKTLAEVRAMTTDERTSYFETYARYFKDSPETPYAIRVGSKTLFSNDTMGLRKQFDRLLRWGPPRPERTMSSTKIRATINRLALAPIRICRTWQVCCLCNKPITSGDEYRDAGKDCRAHVGCFKAAAQENRT